MFQIFLLSYTFFNLNILIHFPSHSLQLLEEGEEGKDRANLRSKLELPVQVLVLHTNFFAVYIYLNIHSHELLSLFFNELIYLVLLLLENSHFLFLFLFFP